MWLGVNLEYQDKELEFYFEGNWELQKGVEQQQLCIKMFLEGLMVVSGRGDCLEFFYF